MVGLRAQVGMTGDPDTPLALMLKRSIRTHGPITVHDFMQACLLDPAHGYYRSAPAVGMEGDFITAPEISQIFGELIGLWSAVTWQLMGEPRPVRLVELGPGRGTLMRDAISAARKVPAFLQAVDVHLIEVNAQLRQKQRETLASLASATWHETLDQIPAGPAILIANEFLDALPIRQFIGRGGAWNERTVEVTPGGRFRFGSSETTGTTPPGLGDPPRDGALAEVRPGEDDLIAGLARRAAPLVALFIDYGPAGTEQGDTLQAVQGHAPVDLFAGPGLADVTAHVRFGTLADKARSAGFAVGPVLTQAEFLGRLGAVERASRLMASSPEHAASVEAGIARLLSPQGMGTRFKVLALRSPHLPPLPAFG